MLKRYVVVGGEPELALLLHIFPEGVEELDGAFDAPPAAAERKSLEPLGQR